MKPRDKWHDEIGQAVYEAEVGDFRKMNILLDEIMALQEAAQHSVPSDGLDSEPLWCKACNEYHYVVSPCPKRRPTQSAGDLAKASAERALQSAKEAAQMLGVGKSPRR